MKLPRWELRHTADPLDTRAYGGGGDGGAGQARADEQDRQKKVQASVDAINAKFGVAPTTAQAAAPDRSAFVIAPTQGRMVQGGPSSEVDGSTWYEDATPGGFDEAGYNKALAAFNASQTDVGAAKAARESMYSDISGAVRDTAMRDLDRQYGKASKQNTFGLARSGLMGGSVDAESGGELATLYGEGRLKAEQQGMGAAADLRGQDEKTRSNLISLAQSGLDTGTAASMAAGQMASAADLAKSQANTASVGDLFGNLSQAYLTNKVLAARYPNGLPQAPSGYGGSSMFGTQKYTGTPGR